jgi:hypothetical protein
MFRSFFTISLLLTTNLSAHAEQPTEFFSKHCFDCHSASSKKGGLDLTALKFELTNADNFAKWVKIHDRIESGEMPPRKEPRPARADLKAVTMFLKTALVKAEQDKFKGEPRTGVRRLTRAEYENTIRDLLDLPGINLQSELPPDGSAHGFDKTSDALDISHVTLAKYLEAADHALDVAIATQPRAPISKIQRVSLANPGGFVAHVLLHGDGVLLKNKQPDPDFPPAGNQMHIGEGPHEQMGSFRNGASVGLFRHEDESFTPYFIEFTSIYPARYRIRTSLWSFQWDKGQVLPSRGTEVGRLSIVQMTGDGRGGGHPSTLLGYFDAPSIKEQTHEVETWLNSGETIGFNAATIVSGHTRGEGRLLKYIGPGIACDYLDVEGPLYDTWPPASHRRLFGDLPLVEFKPDQQLKVLAPKHVPFRQKFFGKNQAEPVEGIWTVKSEQPLADADRLLAAFLPKAFRRPVANEVRQAYVSKVQRRLEAGDCFETAMRWAYRAALCSPDFLYHIESTASADPRPRIDDYGLASRLSYFFWNSMPDDRLLALAAANTLHQPQALKAEVERLLADKKARRFHEDFLGQWLRLRQIAANDPDGKLYPEFRPYLQDSMVAETRAYFRELIEKDLNASYLIKSDFAMLNEKLAIHYGIPGVTGSQIRRVALPKDSPRGPFLTQASILKITANGTTTSPVPRGAFVMARLLGQPPEPPPANVAAVEPDVRGATTIREQLARHRNNSTCASCHAKIDPPGFALESFDVIGGQRDRYRTITNVKPLVDPSGVLPDGRPFKNITEFQALVAPDSDRLLSNLARQFAIYGIGRGLSFSDRDPIVAIVAKTKAQGGGVRTLIHELVQSELFQTK